MRVLVVDDFEPFRRFVCSALQQRAGFLVIGEAADGLQAIQRTEELQPDLIVLDIGMPRMNGIEAARQIRKICPNSKIIFVSQDSSTEVVREAFQLGARAYLAKSDLANDLLSGIDAVLEGKEFLSRRLANNAFQYLQDTRPVTLTQQPGFHSSGRTR